MMDLQVEDQWDRYGDSAVQSMLTLLADALQVACKESAKKLS